jgi:hypothetical protein
VKRQHLALKRLHQQVTVWGHDTLSKLKQRDWRIWLAVVVVGYVFMEAIRTQISDASTLVVVWIGKGILWLAHQPMGIGGLAVLAYMVVLVSVSWWQTRPKVESESLPQPELSEVDRRIIQDLRTIWNRHGCHAVRQLHDLLKGTTYELKQRVYWGVLVEPIANELEQSIDRMTHAVAFDTTMSVTQIRERFNEMYSSYLMAIKWLAKLAAKGDIIPEGERLVWWKESHYHFYERLQDLNQVPEHNQSLKIYINFIDDDAFGKLLRAAERRPLPSD